MHILVCATQPLGYSNVCTMLRILIIIILLAVGISTSVLLPFNDAGGVTLAERNTEHGYR